MPKFNLDITGFYYAVEVETHSNPTVVDIMDAAKNTPSANGGRFDFDLDGRGFVKWLEVKYDDPPTSRQQSPKRVPPGSPPPSPREKLPGTYRFTDDINKEVKGDDGAVSGFLTWQYYVFDGDELLNNKASGRRVIRSSSESNLGPGAVIVPEGGLVVWRLVGIFGTPPEVIAKATAGRAATVKEALSEA